MHVAGARSFGLFAVLLHVCWCVQAKQLQLLCNSTSSCRACGLRELKAEPECKATGFSRGLECVVGSNSSSTTYYEVIKELEPDQSGWESGKAVLVRESCPPVRQLSATSFEVGIVALMLCAYYVVLRRKRQLQRLTLG
jgi:hypothetical protein